MVSEEELGIAQAGLAVDSNFVEKGAYFATFDGSHGGS